MPPVRCALEPRGAEEPAAGLENACHNDFIIIMVFSKGMIIRKQSRELPKGRLADSDSGSPILDRTVRRSGREGGARQTAR